MLCLVVGGAALAGWQAKRATDPALIDPIVMPDDIELRTGDIIIAGGVSLQSRLVRSMTEDNRYSHVGLIEVTPQGAFVIHAAPTGAGDGGVGDKVAKIPLGLFLAERGYVAVRVMRLKAQTAEAKQAAEDACAFSLACVDKAVPFDNAFDLSEQEKIYCSELVALVPKSLESKVRVSARHREGGHFLFTDGHGARFDYNYVAEEPTFDALFPDELGVNRTDLIWDPFGAAN